MGKNRQEQSHQQKGRKNVVEGDGAKEKLVVPPVQEGQGKECVGIIEPAPVFLCVDFHPDFFQQRQRFWTQLHIVREQKGSHSLS